MRFARALVSSAGVSGEVAAPSIHLVVDRIHFLRGCWAEGLSSSQAVGWRLISVSFYTGLSLQ